MSNHPHQSFTSVNVNVKQGNSGCVRALYFLFIGWWLGFFWLNFGFLLCFLIVTLPIGLAMLNRLPRVLTLRSSGTSTSIGMTSVAYGGTTMNTVSVNIGATAQRSFLTRALYFIFIGWWFGYLWAVLGYCCCVSLILLPVGLVMLNRLPAVLTLRRN
jgi:uncharacterized membrane protein YccF (DUF307 family)